MDWKLRRKGRMGGREREEEKLELYVVSEVSMCN